ncbi:MAG: heme-binding domain-containing protein [Candidatus Zixiibacteriota bacterium]
MGKRTPDWRWTFVEGNSRRMLSVLLISAALSAAVLAQTRESGRVAADTAAIDSPTGSAVESGLDSVYSAIQTGFADVRPIFERGCFDCHSTKTHYPWYYRLPIVKGQIDGDIRQARRHLDMTNGFPFQGHGTPADDLSAIREEIDSGDMPPLGYRLFHWNAKPNAAEAQAIDAWIERSLALLAAHGQLPAGVKDEGEGEE